MTGRIGPKTWAEAVQASPPALTQGVCSPPVAKYTLLRDDRASPLGGALQEGDEEKALRLIEADPSVLSGEKEGGYSLVYDACVYGASAPFVEFLINNGAERRVLVGPDVMTPQGVARGKGLSHLLPFFPGKCPHTEFILDSKAVGHVIGVSQSVPLLLGARFELEGLWSSYWPPQFLRGIDGYVRHCDSQLKETQIGEMQFQLGMVNHSCRTVEMCLAQLKSDCPFALYSGWEGHSVFILFWREYLIVCDPSAFGSDATIDVLKIDPERITQEIIDEILHHHFTATREEGVAYFSYELPTALGAQEAILSDADREVVKALTRLAPPSIARGVCSFASLSNALKVIAFCVGVAHDGDVTRVERRVERDFSRLLAYMKGQVLFEYLSRWGSDPMIHRKMMREAFAVTQKELSRAFPHLHDVAIETQYGTMRADDLLNRCRVILKRR